MLLDSWCKAHYGEVYSGWIHLKAILCFVESVLRYGLPADFVPVFLEPNMKKEKQLKSLLLKTLAHLRSEAAELGADEEENDEDSTDSLPYVCHKFNVGGAGMNS